MTKKVKQIRHSVFETNSSSTHSITICSAEEFEKFKSGDLVYDDYKDVFVDSSTVDVDSDTDRYQTFDNYFDNDYLETYTSRYTSKSGDEIVVFGKYGNDY